MEGAEAVEEVVAVVVNFVAFNETVVSLSDTFVNKSCGNEQEDSVTAISRGLLTFSFRLLIPPLREYSLELMKCCF